MSLFQTVAEMKTRGEEVPEHLRDLPLQDSDIGPKRWENVCGHPLQPLVYCLEAVRVEFLHFASNFGLLDSDMLERLSGESVVTVPPATSRPKPAVDDLGIGSNPLKSFFPFDPYLLKNSFPFIQPLYRYWSGQGDVEASSIMESAVPTVRDDEDPMEDETEEFDVSSSDSDDENEEKFITQVPSQVPSTPPAFRGEIFSHSEAQTRNRSHSFESTGSW